MACALVYLFANLIGMGLGPLAAGILSDAFSGWAGQDSLRYALLLLSPGYFLVAWHAWRASKTVLRDLAATADHGQHERNDDSDAAAQYASRLHHMNNAAQAVSDARR
jgi:MFS family permease